MASKIKVDLYDKLKNDDVFVIEYQIWNANLDHAKAFTYPLIADAKVGMWIAWAFPAYLVKAVCSLNDAYKTRKRFFLVTATNVIEKQIEDSVRAMDFTPIGCI